MRRRPLAAMALTLTLLCGGCGVAAPPSFVVPGVGSALLATLAGGTDPATVWLAGDSTGDSRDEWFCRTMDSLGDRYQAYSLSHVVWSHDLHAWQPRLGGSGLGCPPRFGAAGDRFVTTSAAAYPVVRAGAALNVPGDLDVRAKVAPDDWGAAATQTVAAKFGPAGDRSWRLLLKQGRLVAERSVDGASADTATSMIAPPFGDGTPGWVRFTLDADNGAGGATLAFLVSNNGADWVPLGEPTTLPAGAPFASAHDVEVGTHTSGADPLVGKSYFLEIRDGIDGRPVAALDMDSVGSAPALVDLLGNVVELVGAPPVGGSPGIVVYNGSVVGETVLYAEEPARFPALTPVPAEIAFISFGHNHGTAPTMRQPYDRLTDALARKWPRTRIIAVGQNPQRPPRTAEQIAAQAARMAELAELARSNRLGYLDAYTPMASDPARYVRDDGVHPTEAGSLLWRDLAVDILVRSGG